MSALPTSRAATFAEQELSRHGIGVSYCDDGQRWQGGDLAYVDCDSPNEWELTLLQQ